MKVGVTITAGNEAGINGGAVTMLIAHPHVLNTGAATNADTGYSLMLCSVG